jgi:hypothetical protein
MDNDTIIFKYIQEHSPVSLPQILRELKPKGTGFSEVTIKKRLGKMVDHKKIRRIKSDEFQNFGISEEDSRVTYYASVNMADIASYLDTLFSVILLESADLREKISALEEIDLYRYKSILTPQKLDDLCIIIDANEEIFKLSIDILHDYVIFKHVSPLKKEDCIKKLNCALSKYRKNPHTHDEVNKVFQILGFFSDNSLIDLLEQDAKDENPLVDWERDYKIPGAIKILEGNRERLRLLMNSLKENGRSDVAEKIKDIRIFALQHDFIADNARKGGGFYS